MKISTSRIKFITLIFATYFITGVINDLNASTVTVSLNETVNPQRWNSVGKFHFPVGQSASVKLSNQSAASGLTVVADAIAFVRVPGDTIFVDNADVSGVIVAGVWSTSTFTPGFYKTNYIYCYSQTKENASVTYTPTITVEDDYEVLVTWRGTSGRCTNVPIIVSGITLIPPTPPTNLSVTNLSTLSFTLNWGSVTGTTVAGYNVYKDGVFYGTTTGTSMDIISLKQNTSYSMTVKTKDVDGNISRDPSAALVVTTATENPNRNYAPSANPILTKIYANRGQQVLVLSGITDGDNNKVQQIKSLTATSSNTKLLTVDKIDYTSPNSVAFIYVSDSSKVGNVDIKIRIQDDGGTANSGVDTLVFSQTFKIATFTDPGVNYQEYDTKSWEARPTSASVPTVGSYRKNTETNKPADAASRTFYWASMTGYIVPTETGTYSMQGFAYAGLTVFLNLSDGISKDPAKLTKIATGVDASGVEVGYNGGSAWTYPDPLSLVAGKCYYFEAYGRFIVGDMQFWLKWSGGPSAIPMSYITSANLSVDFDISKPTTPADFKVSNLGVNDISLSWSPSSDDRKVTGYNVLVNGVIQKNSKLDADSIITGTTYMVKGLDSNTTYTLNVIAVDAFKNNSLPSTSINATTYNADNNPPPVPTNLSSDFVTALGVKLKWNSVKDVETQTRGYNVYQDLKLIAKYVPDTVLLVTGLTERTSYNFTVSAVDANYNESAQSSIYKVQTTSFDPNETRDGVKKGRLTVNMKPLVQFDGIGVGVNYAKDGILSSNIITYGGFESPVFDTLQVKNLSYIDKAVGGSGVFSRKTIAPFYKGSGYMQLNAVAANDYFRCKFGQRIDKRYTYTLKFGAKCFTGFTGTLQIKMADQFGSYPLVVSPSSITLTDTWQEYTVTLTTPYESASVSWNLDFVVSAPGFIYLDDISLVNKSNYDPNSKFSTKAVELLKELKPAAIRWGAIPANKLSFKNCTGVGAEATFTYGDWINLANQLKAKAYFEIGIDKSTDYKKDSTTYRTLIQYIGGSATTTGGAIRVSEGYNNLISNSKGILLGIGNEVWGGSKGTPNHYSAFEGTTDPTVANNYIKYGIYARAVGTIVKNSEGFDPKIKTAYSGRSPGLNYGLHAAMLTGDKGEVDNLAISGYLGGNFSYSPNIELGVTQLDYHKDGITMMQDNFMGLRNDWKEMMTLTGRILPMYFYETNMSTSSYNRRVGQAVTLCDYLTTVPLYGVVDRAIFNFTGDQFALIEDEITYNKTPLFYAAKYINNYCTGVMLDSKLTTSNKIYTKDGVSALTIDPVGCKAYTDSTSYSVAMFSRDFENDYQIQLDIPDNVGNGSTCKIYTLTGTNYSATQMNITEQSLYNFKDSILVSVPKYSIVIVRFDGINNHLTAPDFYADYKHVESIKASIVEAINVIDGKVYKRLRVKAALLPADAFINTVNWSIIDPENTGAYIQTTTTTTSIYVPLLNSAPVKNGTIKVVAMTTDGSMLSDTLTIYIHPITAIDEVIDNSIKFYPNPVLDILNLNTGNGDFIENVAITDLSGKILFINQIENNEAIINVSELNKGIYFAHIKLKNGVKTIKFLK